jgi:hypothetical protein
MTTRDADGHRDRGAASSAGPDAGYPASPLRRELRRLPATLAWSSLRPAAGNGPPPSLDLPRSPGPVVESGPRIEPGTTWPLRLKTPSDWKCQECGYVGALLKQVSSMHE